MLLIPTFRKLTMRHLGRFHTDQWHTQTNIIPVPWNGFRIWYLIVYGLWMYMRSVYDPVFYYLPPPENCVRSDFYLPLIFLTNNNNIIKLYKHTGHSITYFLLIFPPFFWKKITRILIGLKRRWLIFKLVLHCHKYVSPVIAWWW